MKIAKHSKNNHPEAVTGQLLGLDVNRTLEVTNCFPFPNSQSRYEDDDDDEDGDAGTDYQMEMMRCLREVNVDAYTVGWYQTAELSSFSNEVLIETQYNYQTNPLLSRKCISLVYDPIMTLQTGKVCIKALRLTKEFIAAYAKDPSISNGFNRQKIFEEVPCRVTNSALAKAFIWSLDLNDQLTPSFEHLDLSSNNYLEKNLEYLTGYLDDLQNENGRLQHHQRQYQRQQNQVNAYLHKVRTENQARRQKGQPEVAEDLSQFKKVTPPVRLPSLVWMNQIDIYVDQVESFANEAAGKLFTLSEIQKQAQGSE